MAAKAAAQKADAPAPRNSLSTQGSPRPSLDVQSRASTESADRASLGLKETQDTTSEQELQERVRKSQESTGLAADPSEALTNGEKDTQEKTHEPPKIRTSVDLVPRVPSPAVSLPTTDVSLDNAPETKEPFDSNGATNEGRTAGVNKDVEDLRIQHQDEVHGYIERIDALEAKLQYLAREGAESARKAALAAPAGSVEKKLAERDQKIAQLMEEGKNLASNEQKHRTILKKLRSKVAEDEKELNKLHAAKEKSDKELDNLRRRARQATELEKTNEDLQKRLDQSQRELKALRPEAKSKDSVIAELKTQLQKATEQADIITLKANDQAREQDRRRIVELEDSVAALQVEKNLVADRAKAQANELKEKAERANERSRALELELKGEVQVMESKLEAMRIRAEEASSGAMGDSQAKLLRQVETLQTQYSIASENWQGIEATLLARIASLERERDEALQRESDMRRKAREAVSTFTLPVCLWLATCAPTTFSRY